MCSRKESQRETWSWNGVNVGSTVSISQRNCLSNVKTNVVCMIADKVNMLKAIQTVKSIVKLVADT